MSWRMGSLAATPASTPDLRAIEYGPIIANQRDMKSNAFATRFRPIVPALVIAAGVLTAVHPGLAAVKARIDFDKTFDFKGARTWSWNSAGAGQVIVARTQEDDPQAIQQLAEPIILQTVNAELPRRGIKPATSAPDLTLMYYLLLTVGSSTQTLGQFLPSTAQWGLPPFAPSTTSISMVEQGSLVLDFSSNGRVVWRGVGEAKIDTDMDQKRRSELLREGVRELLKRFPPKS
jgi:hypothetical protein